MQNINDWKSGSNDKLLIGANFPNDSLHDGDFMQNKSFWKTFSQSPFWESKVVEKGGVQAGLSQDKLSSGGNACTTYQCNINCDLATGDKIKWRFRARSEYLCTAFVTLVAVYTNSEQKLSQKEPVPYAPNDYAVFSGVYEVTKQDENNQFVGFKLIMQSDFRINVFVDFVDIALQKAGDQFLWDIKAESTETGIQILINSDDNCDIYRSDELRTGYKKIATNVSKIYTDLTAISGKNYYYTVKLAGNIGAASYPVGALKFDDKPTSPPTNLTAISDEFKITRRHAV